VKPRPTRTRRLYLTVGQRTTGRSLSTGRGATAAALARRASRRRCLRPGYDTQMSVHEHSKKFSFAPFGIGQFEATSRPLEGAIRKDMGFEFVPGRSAHAHDAASPCGSLISKFPSDHQFPKKCDTIWISCLVKKIRFMRAHSRCFWSWLLCLIAYITIKKIESACQPFLIVTIEIDLSTIYSYIRNSEDSITHHCDGWRSEPGDCRRRRGLLLVVSQDSKESFNIGWNFFGCGQPRRAAPPRLASPTLLAGCGKVS
jgi:hypothetical protein